MKPARHVSLLTAIFLVTTTALAQAVQKNEVIHYDVKKLGVDLGDASLSIKGKTKIDGEDAILIVFKVEALNFYDEEKIYMDPVTLYPIIVERDLNIWGKRETIVETYDQEESQIKIIKQAKNKTTQTILHKIGKVDNIFCFLYRHRKYGTFTEKELKLELPTKDVTINYDSIKKLKIDEKTYNAFYYESKPAEYRLWFSTTAERLPLRLDGAVGMAKTSLIMKEIQP